MILREIQFNDGEAFNFLHDNFNPNFILVVTKIKKGLELSYALP